VEPITVLLVDDHPVVRHGLSAMLQTDPQIDVVGEAGSGQEALVMVGQLNPRVVLMDIHMPEMDGLAATRRVKELYPRTAVILLTLYNNEQYVVEAVRSGAGGYLLKNASREEILNTIREVSNGGMLIKTTDLQKVLAGTTKVASLDFRGQPWGVDGIEPLSARELEVLKLVVEGATNKDVGNHLNIAEDTAKKHVQNIILKLQVSDRTQAAVKALRLGLVQ
jgi:DNA-binding NarL/FixJ family response regulator